MIELQNRLETLKAFPGRTILAVTFTDGTAPIIGLFTGYTDADDNEEGVASIDIRFEKGKPEYCLFENEIESIELA